MPEIIFSHPDIRNPLVVQTGADKIKWGYGLNHVTYPTYGGEVVQILSCYIDDLTIEGTVGSYADMERIYGWFLTYIQIASQGRGSDINNLSSYVEAPVTMKYPSRSWELKVKPKSLPGYRIATDVVAPTWQIQCHVLDADAKMKRLTMDSAEAGLADFSEMNAGIGFEASNQFSDPFPSKDKKELDEATLKAFDEIGDYFSGLIGKYASGDFESLLGSKPPDYLTAPDDDLKQVEAPKSRPKKKNEDDDSPVASTSAKRNEPSRPAPASRRDQQVKSYPLGVVGMFNGGPGVGTHDAGSGDYVWQDHNAVDLNCPYGTPVFAVENATITKVRKGTPGTAGQGWQVTMSAAGRQWFYGHLSSVWVNEGQTVKARQRLGDSGFSGRNHLHIACSTGNPMRLLGIRN